MRSPHLTLFAGMALVLGLAHSATASLVTIQTRQTTFAIICTDGTLLCAGGTRSQVDDNAVDSISHSNNFDGTLTTSSEARTAARSGPSEIAANATLRQRELGPFENYSDVFGDALFEWDVLVLDEGDVSFTFNLPPGFVEYQTNAELRSLLDLTAGVQVDIQTCAPACGYSPANPSLFQMYSTLSGNFDNYQLHNGASSVNPGLDTSALTHQNVVDDDEGFIRTYTWEFDPFTGEIPLGHFVGGQTFSLSYRMIGEVYADFGGFLTWAAAAINDPFFLDSDPLPQQPLVTFHFTPSSSSAVPEPGTTLLVVCGLVGSTLLRGPGRARRRRRGGARREGES